MRLTFKIETEEIKRYLNCMKNKSISIKDISELMIEDYKKLNDKERLSLRYSLNDAINDIDKVSLLSILTTILLKLTIDNILFNTAIFFAISIYFIYLIKIYRMCKLYLEVINDFRLGYIKDEKSYSKLRQVLNNRNNP